MVSVMFICQHLERIRVDCYIVLWVITTQSHYSPVVVVVVVVVVVAVVVVVIRTLVTLFGNPPRVRAPFIDGAE